MVQNFTYQFLTFLTEFGSQNHEKHIPENLLAIGADPDKQIFVCSSIYQ